MEKVYYFNPGYMRDSVVMKKNSLDRELIRYYLEEILTRPEKTELPKHLGEIGTLQFEFTLDFGSFRDIARHRALIQRMPLVTPEYGFHGWYLEQLPVSLREEALLIILFLDTWWNSLNSSTKDEEFKAMLQYYLPMGYRVACRITGDLPSLLYLVELRSGVMVHATLREVAQDIGKIIENLGIPVYIDRSEIGRFDIKRGAQDIVMK